MEQYTSKKSTCEKYTIRWGSYGWAVFTIDENGLFNCQSDYGDYNYMWGNHGCKSFKHFIIKMARDTSYLLKKVAKADTFDYEKTLAGWKDAIISERKELNCSKRQARDAWDVITSQGDYESSPDILLMQICDSEAISDIWDEPWYVFDVDKDYSPQAIAFAHEIMPMFADILKKEIEETDAKKALLPTEPPRENSQEHYTIGFDLSKVESLTGKWSMEDILRNEG